MTNPKFKRILGVANANESNRHLSEDKIEKVSLHTNWHEMFLEPSPIVKTPQATPKPVEILEDEEQAPPGTFNLGDLESILVLNLEFTMAQSFRERDFYLHFPLNP